MTFQVLDYKGKNFIDLNGDDHSPTKPTYLKGGTWLNLICVPQELLQIMLQLVNIILDSSSKNPSLVHAENIQSKQEIISWMVANSLGITGTPKGNH